MDKDREFKKQDKLESSIGNFLVKINFQSLCDRILPEGFNTPDVEDFCVMRLSEQRINPNDFKEKGLKNKIEHLIREYLDLHTENQSDDVDHQIDKTISDISESTVKDINNVLGEEYDESKIQDWVESHACLVNKVCEEIVGQDKFDSDEIYPIKKFIKEKICDEKIDVFMMSDAEVEKKIRELVDCFVIEQKESGLEIIPESDNLVSHPNLEFQNINSDGHELPEDSYLKKIDSFNGVTEVSDSTDVFKWQSEFFNSIDSMSNAESEDVAANSESLGDQGDELSASEKKGRFAEIKDKVSSAGVKFLDGAKSILPKTKAVFTKENLKKIPQVAKKAFIYLKDKAISAANWIGNKAPILKDKAISAAKWIARKTPDYFKKLPKRILQNVFELGVDANDLKEINDSTDFLPKRRYVRRLLATVFSKELGLKELVAREVQRDNQADQAVKGFAKEAKRKIDGITEKSKLVRAKSSLESVKRSAFRKKVSGKAKDKTTVIDAKSDILTKKSELSDLKKDKSPKLNFSEKPVWGKIGAVVTLPVTVPYKFAKGTLKLGYSAAKGVAKVATWPVRAPFKFISNQRAKGAEFRAKKKDLKDKIKLQKIEARQARKLAKIQRVSLLNPANILRALKN